MTMHRFFVEPDVLRHRPIALQGELAHQIKRVLRLKPGDQIELLDDSGEAWLVALEQVSSSLCVVREVDRYRPDTEPTRRLILYQAISKGHKLDWVCQKATELGVSELVPMATARSVGANLRELGPTRLVRLQRIAQEAAEQSGRAVMPTVRPAIAYGQALAERGPRDLALIGVLTPGALPIRQVFVHEETPPGTVRLFIGPEGGFEDAEVELARARGVRPVSLGPRVLRTETAGIALLAIMAHLLGELEPR
jgi:16S rRNA (uracil1498-N3)-methyltransferase